MIKFDKKSLFCMAATLGLLIMSIANCVSNIVVLNIFSLVIDLLFVCIMCFALGYAFCRAEASMATKKENTEEKVDKPYVPPTDKYLNEL